MRHVKRKERRFQTWIEGLYLLCGCRGVIQVRIPVMSIKDTA